MPHFIVCPLLPRGDLVDANGTMALTDKLAKDCLKVLHTSKDAATQVANDLAAKNPTVQFAVFAPDEIFETLQPKVIRKVINDRGEVVVKEQT